MGCGDIRVLSEHRMARALLLPNELGAFAIPRPGSRRSETWQTESAASANEAALLGQAVITAASLSDVTFLTWAARLSRP